MDALFVPLADSLGASVDQIKVLQFYMADIYSPRH